MVQYADTPLPQSTTPCLHPVFHKLRLTYHLTEGRRLSQPEYIAQLVSQGCLKMTGVKFGQQPERFESNPRDKFHHK